MDGNKMLTYPKKKNTLQIVQTCQPTLVHYTSHARAYDKKTSSRFNQNMRTFSSKRTSVFLQTNVHFSLSVITTHSPVFQERGKADRTE